MAPADDGDGAGADAGDDLGDPVRVGAERIGGGAAVFMVVA